jgi:glycosyltransferase involved in cell wall biosynthesis
MPRVSVVIPAYNRADTLPDALDSLLAQTYVDFEVIVVDDGSTDNTKSVVEEYCKKDSRIIYYYQENKERSAARNQGIRLSRGEYITFLDADDAYFPQKIEKQVAVLDSVKDADFVYCHYKAMDRAGNPVGNGDPLAYNLSGNIYPEILRFTGVSITTPGVMVRKKLLDKIGGFDETMNSHEDFDLWRRAARVTRIEQMQEALIAARVGASGTERKYLWRGYKARKCFYRKAIKEDKKLSFYFKTLLYTELYVVYGKTGFSKKEWGFAAYMGFRLFLMAPFAARQLAELYRRYKRKARIKNENISFGRL